MNLRHWINYSSALKNKCRKKKKKKKPRERQGNKKDDVKSIKFSTFPFPEKKKKSQGYEYFLKRQKLSDIKEETDEN